MIQPIKPHSAADLLSIFDDRRTFMSKSLAGIDKETKLLQRELLEMLTNSVIDKLTTVDGKLVLDGMSLVEVGDIDARITELMNVNMATFFKPIGRDMLNLTTYSAEYFTAVGFAKSQINDIVKTFDLIENSVGITRKGTVIQGGFIATLAQAEPLKQEIKEFVTSNLANGTELTKFKQKFKTLIEGKKDVDGRLQAYTGQYVHDTMYQVEAATDAHFADTLGMKYFLYVGSIIDTTREFCKKKLERKVWSIEEANTEWWNDPALLKASNDSRANYNPLIDRGRWNCRHRIRFITDAQAKDYGHPDFINE